MPDFTPTYTPVAGNALDPGGLNNNLYRVTAGRSVFEIMDGSIEAVNFDPSFQVRSYHVRPGQAGEALSVGQVLHNDYFSDLFLGDAEYTAIVGATVTFRQKWASSLSLLGASGFCTVWRQFGANTGAFGARAAAPDVHVQAFVQSGASAIRLIGHTKRELPQTVHWNSASGSPDGQIAMREARLTRHFNLVHPCYSGGAGTFAALSSGWHTYGLAILVRQNLSGQDTSDVTEDYRLQLNGAGTPDARPSAHYSAVHRVRMYVRNASGVRLL